MPLWVCFIQALVVSVRYAGSGGALAYIHIGVGFDVARSGKMGNAKASKSGTGK